MKRLTSYEEIEKLCEAAIRDFFKRKHYTNSRCVDIEGFVTEYLGLPIVYEKIREDDPGRQGFLSDGERPLWILTIKDKFGKNAVLKGLNYQEGARGRERNNEVGGHKA